MNDSDEWGISPEPELDVPMTDVEQIYLNRRWLLRSDPRSVLRGERPPEPPFAADPQLEAAVRYLWEEIGSAESFNTSEAAEPEIAELQGTGQ
jgi:hypothetical protein